MLRRGTDLLSGTIARGILRLYAWRAGSRSVAVGSVRRIAQIGTGPDPLVSPWHRTVSGRMLRHPGLAELLADHRLGAWSLGPQTIAYLHSEISYLRPRQIIEFGSGVSTVCLARFMLDIHGPGSGLLVASLEQSLEFAEASSDLLHRAGLSAYAAVLHAPLVRQVIEGIDTVCYELPDDLAELVVQGEVDYVVVDGPAGAEGARFGTLPLVRPFLSDRARFVLDDAFRDGELRIAERWSEIQDLRVEGLRAIEKGLLVGSVHRRTPMTDTRS